MANHQELAVSDIVRDYLPSYPQEHSWDVTVEYLYTHEAAHMEELYEAIQREGLREPVWLSSYTDEPEQFVLDGTHRVALALRHGLLTLPITFTPEQLGVEDASLIAIVQLLDESSLSDVEEDYFAEAVRSWRLDEHSWLTSSGMAGSGNLWEIFLDSADETLIPSAEVRLSQILAERVPERNFNITIELQKFEDM